VRICFNLCVSHHYQVIEEEHLSLMWSLFLRFIYIGDLIESTAAHQPTVRNWQYLREKERDQIWVQLPSAQEMKRGISVAAWADERNYISYGGTVFCCAVMWNLKLQRQTNEQFQSQVSFFIPVFRNWFTHLLAYRSGKNND